MAELVYLPAATYQPPSSSQGRRLGRAALNTIMEEEDDNNNGAQAQPAMLALADRRGARDNNDSNLKIEAWLSPLSDHFPTPRGFHFLAAPVLPESPSAESADDALSPTNSSNPWTNRRSVMTDATEFDDLYDDMSSEDEDAHRFVPRKSSLKRTVAAPAEPRRALPPLVIPNANDVDDAWQGLKKLTSPVPPTPPTAVAMSPAALSFIQAQQAQDIPTISAPPSLDGSLTSEQMAQMSAPPTPIIGNNEDDSDDNWTGIQLQPGALATLHALSGESDSLEEHEHQPEQVIEIPEAQPQPQPAVEARRDIPRLFTNFRPVAPRGAELTPDSQRRSVMGLTRLDIPSPGGFFSGLSPRTRTTWHMPPKSPEDMVPPTSTTAEQFYRCPWNEPIAAPLVPILPKRPATPPEEQYYRSSLISSSANSSEPVERVIEVRGIMNDDDMPTARPIVPDMSVASESGNAEPSSPDADVIPTEIVIDHDPDYARKQQEVALGNLDRTELWLMAQRVYLQGVSSPDEEEESGGLATISEKPEDETAKMEAEADLTVALPKKKTVRFSEIIQTSDFPRRLPSKLFKQESAYYRAFQDYIIHSRQQDAFVHRLPRFEALQAQRISLREAHRNQLLGKYQLSVVPQSAKKRMSANVARGDDILIDDPEKLKREKEHDAALQMAMSNWHVAAIKLINGGRLISAPVAKRLARVSRMAPGKDGVSRDRARILDLGGMAACDWAWHCAMQYPNTKVYTVTTKAIRQLSNSNIRGPLNHRQVAVDRLTRLPFMDNQFDLVSARELHSILKFVGENGEDEWESCLREIMRVLKPGGYLEFSLLDSDIINAGPLGLAKSVEFGFNLKTLGYDPCPTKMWLGRLSRAGFEETRRAWLCLPMGERRPAKAPLPPLKDSPTGEEVRTHELEAMVTGGTESIASIGGLVGGWSWERWLLRCEMEKVASTLRLADTVTAGAAMLEADKCLDGVHAIVDEGRNCGAGWRVLNGYARKPKASMGFISIGVDASA